MKCLNLFLGLLFIPSLLLLFGGSYANAASPYDDIIQLTNELEVTVGDNPNETVDFSSDWYTEAREALRLRCVDQGQTEFCQSYEALRDIDFSTYSYMVWQTNYTNGNSSFKILFTDNSFAEIYFSSIGGNSEAIVTQTEAPYEYYQIEFGIYPANSSSVETEKGLSVNTPSPTYSDNQVIVTSVSSEYITYPSYYKASKIFLSTFYFNQPVGYEGEIPPDTWTPPAEPNNAVPDIDFHLDNIYKAQIFDRNFFTFDNNPFLCDGLAPVIDWTIYDQDSITILDQVTLSATGTYTYQFDKTFEASEYLVTAQYRCDSYNFPNQSSREIKFNNVGQLQISNPFEGCFTEEFPWIDLNTCGQNIIDLFTKGLSINRMIFGDEWAPDEDCRQLAILDDWIGVTPQNNNICPFFSTEVRAVITPFVTFIIGLLIIGFVANLRKGL